jgi:hypothetical protein
MSTIQHIEKLHAVLDEAQIKKLEAGAALHKKQSNIHFSVLEVTESQITVATEQEKNSSGKYANQKTLVKRTHELFDNLLPTAVKLQVEATEYLESPSAVVTPEWINQKMLEKGIRIKQIAFDTGVDRTSISDWVNGARAMSQIVKAMFYFYLTR